MPARVTSFAISRAGAVAAVAAVARRRALPLTVRIMLLVGGSLTVGVGAGLTLSTGLGAGPFDVLITGISTRTGLPFAGALWIVAAALALLTAVLGERPGPGTLAAPVIIGPAVQAVIGALHAVPELLVGPVGFGLSVAMQLLGVAVIGLGAGAMVTSGLGAGVGDLVALATSNRLGRSTALVRTMFELAWLGIGLTLGGTAGLGTVLVAVTIGKSVAFGHRQVDSALAGRLSALSARPDFTAGRYPPPSL